MLNTNALVIIFISCGGEYYSIFMHGIVSTDTEGVNTTKFTVAFQICTPYICRDGSEIHLIVALGTKVSVNFILSNDWMKQIGSVLECGAN